MKRNHSTSPTLLHPTAAVGGVVFHEDRVLIVRRGQMPSKGKWAIPGGKVRTGETLLQACERELLEETGIITRARAPIFVFDLIAKTEEAVTQHYIIVDVYAEYLGGNLRAGDDAIDVGWFDHETLLGMDLDENTRRFLQAWWPRLVNIQRGNDKEFLLAW